MDAVSRGDEALVEKMLEDGMDPNVSTADGLTALHQVRAGVGDGDDGGGGGGGGGLWQQFAVVVLVALKQFVHLFFAVTHTSTPHTRLSALFRHALNQASRSHNFWLPREPT